uniref:Uncharacterized protein n=1 Tax=Helianthus annuus TaxID=4232 RepID=A0A251V7R0_HELAN
MFAPTFKPRNLHGKEPALHPTMPAISVTSLRDGPTPNKLDLERLILRPEQR